MADGDTSAIGVEAEAPGEVCCKLKAVLSNITSAQFLGLGNG